MSMINAHQPTAQEIQEHGLVAFEHNGQTFWIIEPPASLAEVSNAGQFQEWVMSSLPLPKEVWLSWAQGDPGATLLVALVSALVTVGLLYLGYRLVVAGIRRLTTAKAQEAFKVRYQKPGKRGATPRRKGLFAKLANWLKR